MSLLLFIISILIRDVLLLELLLLNLLHLVRRLSIGYLNILLLRQLLNLFLFLRSPAFLSGTNKRNRPRLLLLLSSLPFLLLVDLLLFDELILSLLRFLLASIPNSLQIRTDLFILLLSLSITIHFSFAFLGERQRRIFFTVLGFQVPCEVDTPSS
jgi:hypothetical protein